MPGPVNAVEAAEHGGYLLGRTVALNAHRTNPDIQCGPAAGQDLEHVADGSAGGAGHDRQALRETRQAPLSFRGKVAELVQLLLQLSQGQFLSAQALDMHLVDNQLVAAACRVNRRPAADDDLLAI